MTAVLLASICVVMGALAGRASGGSHTDPADARGPLDVLSASLKQHRRSLGLEIRTAQAWSPRDLEARPAMQAAEPESYLCIELRQDDDHRRWCVARGASGKTRLIGGRTDADGNLVRAKRLRGARVRRPGTHAVKAVFRFGAAGLGIGRFGWRILSGWGDLSCALPVALEGRRAKRLSRREDVLQTCRDQAPDQSFYGGRIVRPHVVGCTRDEDMFNSSGPRSRKRIALTFDDGPSVYTNNVLNILNKRHVHSTFFEIGQEMPGRADIMRRIINSGSEIGNHSLHHETNGASAASLSETSARIKAATGFEPCLYRPPGGYISATTSRAAYRQGMSNILWDVDTNDWQGPSSATIYSRVVSAAHSGSIVLMHDGGGNRSATVGALPRIISTLKGRGYELVTVTDLLGEHFRWKP